MHEIRIQMNIKMIFNNIKERIRKEKTYRTPIEMKKMSHSAVLIA